MGMLLMLKWLLLLYSVLVQGLPVHEKHITVGLPATNVSSTQGGMVRAGEEDHGDQDRNVLTQGNRTVRDVLHQLVDYYPATSKLYCQKCPAGTRVAEPCTEPYTSGKCAPCVEGEDYTEWPNGMDKCLTCKSCREDQGLVSHCTTRNDTVCQCKAGSFCLPSQPCEMCQRCKTDCTEGQTVEVACSPTSDSVCGRTELLDTGLLGGIIVLGLILLTGLCFGLLYCQKTGRTRQSYQCCVTHLKGNMWLHRTDSTGSRGDALPGGPLSAVNESWTATSGGGGAAENAGNERMDSDVHEARNERVALLQNSPEASAECQDETTVQSPRHGRIGTRSPTVDPLMAQTELADPDDLTSGLSLNMSNNCETTGNETRGAICSGSPSVETCSTPSQLQPPYKPTGNSQPFHMVKEFPNGEGLRQSFPLFVKEVPIKRWKEFMRKLHLTENEIAEAERNNLNNITEGNYQMLHTWHQKSGNKASVRTLLWTLNDIDLVTAANNISLNLLNNDTKEH
ncbi:tumor necrosis factor receptor superfamily member 10A-like isoform X2 [Heterodontus francisci]|uniref:tumor necrosis factor receptor superfamily member 10A-like isoform X2 n=1 Tax=Heterodontus francisci TaxID=7792 RepID=UPI00355ACE38